MLISIATKISIAITVKSDFVIIFIAMFYTKKLCNECLSIKVI